MGSPTPDQRSSRERLVSAAREVFLERGYAGATVGMIARRAGFTTGAVYSHFRSKEELLSTAIAQSISEGVRGSLDRALPGRSAAEAAHALLLDMLMRPVEAGDVLIMHGLAASLGEGKPVLRPQLVRIIDVTRELIHRGVAERVVDPDVDRDAFLHFTTALLFGSIALKMLELEPPDRDAVVDVLNRFEEAFAPGD